ncbi:unnamed protein product [Didymodactylos carnosus]|uniref:Uncharacterized protein n=1 Tax=Didymodactylos carnosus TaxID=1234261 RepID=A0A814NPX0_9BILA|nr:unnamed protein product [Didymodactylos carnosus]CAF3858750.1 unnamed protein product [Didymodactylos carnosus]
MTLCCIETDDTVCQTLPCLPSLIKWNIITTRDDNNNNIQQPVKEEPSALDEDVRRLMSALGLKSKQRQKLIETSSKALIRVPLPIIPFKRRTQKGLAHGINQVKPLCLLSLRKYDVREPIQFVVTDLKKISVVKHYENYCVTDTLKIPNKQTKRSVQKNSSMSLCPPQRQDVLRSKHRKDVGLKKRLQSRPVSENITLRECKIVLQRLNRSYVEDIIQMQQAESKLKSSPMIKSKTAVTTILKVKKLRSRKKKCHIKRSPSPSNENKPQLTLSTIKRKALPFKSPCDLTELTNSNTTKRQKTITVNNSDYLTENVTKVPLLQTVHPFKFDSICLKCFICNIRQVLSFGTLTYDLHSHWQLHKKLNVTYNIYDTVMDKKCFRMVEYFIPPQHPAMEGRPLDIFVTHGKELQQEQVVIISDDENEDVICLD